MKTMKLFIVILAVLFSGNLPAQTTGNLKSEKFKVLGNCSMCKSRIESAAKSRGAADASWDVESKILAVKYDPKVTSRSAIEKKVVSAGHDTDKIQADDKVYNALPACCKYNRTGQPDNNSGKTNHSGHSHS